MNESWLYNVISSGLTCRTANATFNCVRSESVQGADKSCFNKKHEQVILFSLTNFIRMAFLHLLMNISLWKKILIIVHNIFINIVVIVIINVTLLITSDIISLNIKLTFLLLYASYL